MLRYILAVIICFGVMTNYSQAQEKLRIKLEIDEFGSCIVSVKPTDEPLEEATEFGGDPLKSSRLPKTEVLHNKDGLVRLCHDFSEPDDFKSLFAGWFDTPNTNTRFDKRFQCLLMTSAEGDDAVVTYSYRTAPPITLVCDRYPLSKNSTIRLLLTNDNVGLLGVVVSTGKRGSELDAGKATIAVNWFDMKSGKRGRRRALVQPTEFGIADGVEQKIRLPLPNMKIDDLFRLTIRANSSPQQVHHEISGLLVQGRVVPVFGIVFDERRSVIFVKGWVKGSIAENSGLQIGDVIRTINGKKPDDLQQAVKFVSSTVVGKTLTLGIERAGKASEVSIKSE